MANSTAYCLKNRTFAGASPVRTTIMKKMLLALTTAMMGVSLLAGVMTFEVTVPFNLSVSSNNVHWNNTQWDIHVYGNTLVGYDCRSNGYAFFKGTDTTMRVTFPTNPPPSTNVISALSMSNKLERLKLLGPPPTPN